MDKTPYIKYKNLYIIPTFHSRIEFAKLVRTAYFKVFPDLIAVELPNNVRSEVIEGIQRLPFLSLIGYADSLNPKKLNFVPIDPGDSIIEGIRIGLEFNVPIDFVDLSVSEYIPPSFQLPDDYSIDTIGLPLFYQKISEAVEPDFVAKKNSLRDSLNMADFLKTRENSTKEYDFFEKDVLREKFMASHLKEAMATNHRVLFIVGMAHWEEIKYYLENPEKIKDVELNLVPFKYVKIYNIRSSDVRFLLKELPYHTFKWIKFREKYSKEQLELIETPEEMEKVFDSYNKIDHIKKIFLTAKSRYEKEFKEFVDLHKLKTIFQYSRNLALTEYRLLPDMFHLLITAKNVVDDDYAWKVLEQASKYPYDDESNKYETMKLTMEGGYDPNGRYVKLRRHHSYDYGKDREVPLKKRPEEKYPGQWRDAWNKKEFDIVSYPPEDIIEEDYFAFMRKRALQNLKNLRVKIEEFKSSLMDGIDIKETLRNWAFKQKVYVREEQQIQGKIDTLVVIFDKDDGEVEKYPYRLNWYAEHDKESNLALYSTYPGDYLIGPGISHVEIGGMLSIYPPSRFQEVFRGYSDYLYKDAKNKAERLLKAGILYSKERFIVYAADEPPRKYFYSLAGVKNREIVYIPLDHFNRESLNTIKHVHMLAGRDKRKIAHSYIFLNK